MTSEQAQTTIAATAAGRNFQANLAALQGHQPALAQEVAEIAPDVEWVLGRDGYLTARIGESWWSGCSLPLRAAQAVLKKMDLKGTVSCFLSPTHAAQLRVTLDRIGPGRALIAVVPDLVDLRLILRCGSFADEIQRGRLWFAWGQAWEAELERVLNENDGLPMPGQFVRTTLVAGDVLDGMIAGAQGVFSREIGRRGAVVRSLLETRVEPERICVVAPGGFRLWDHAGGVLGAIGNEQGWKSIAPDDPSNASPIALARAVAGCGKIILANAGRADFPFELPATTKVVSWLTVPRIPRFISNCEDRLILVEERWKQDAIAAGWRADRITVAGWPMQQVTSGGRGLAIIADTVPYRVRDFELSSHRVLWESIARELADDPFAVGQDLGAYLSRWVRRVGIALETLDQASFIDELIVPAYQQGLARWLICAGVELRLFGRGWGQIEEFGAHAIGEINDANDLNRAMDNCAALVHTWPTTWTHPIDSAGKPVLRRGSKLKQMWLNEAKKLARGEGKLSIPAVPPISAQVLKSALGLV